MRSVFLQNCHKVFLKVFLKVGTCTLSVLIGMGGFSFALAASEPAVTLKCPSVAAVTEKTDVGAQPVSTEVSAGASMTATGSDIPLHTLTLASGTTLVVCGQKSSAPVTPGKIQVENVQVYAADGKGNLGPALFSGDPGQGYVLSSKIDRLVVEHLEDVNGGERSMTEFYIACSSSGSDCQMSKPRCAYRRPRLKNLSKLKELKTYLNGRNKGHVPRQSLITEVAELAYDGQKDARRLFSSRPKALKLDASGDEAYRQASTLLSKMEKAGCFATDRSLR